MSIQISIKNFVFSSLRNDINFTELILHRFSRKRMRILAVFRSRSVQRLLFGKTANDVEVYIRYFPSDRTFARRTERTREEDGNENLRGNCGKATSLASLSAARDAKWRSHWIPWDKGSGRADARRGDLFHDRAWILSRILRQRRRKYLVIEINSRIENFIYNSIAIYKCNLTYNLKF